MKAGLAQLTLKGEEFKEVNVLGKMSLNSGPEGPFLE